MNMIVEDGDSSASDAIQMKAKEKLGTVVKARYLVPSKHFRAIASRVLASREDSASSKAIGVVSCGRQNGNSTVVSNLAVAISEAIPGEVLLVDSVVKRKSRGPGWFEFVLGNVDLVDIVRSTDVKKLSVLPSGYMSSRNGITYSKDRLVDVVQHLREQFEFVLFDLPCIDDVAGSGPIASVLDGVLLNIRSGRVNSSNAAKVKRELEVQGAHLLGAVLNQTQSYVPQFLQAILGRSAGSF